MKIRIGEQDYKISLFSKDTEEVLRAKDYKIDNPLNGIIEDDNGEDHNFVIIDDKDKKYFTFDILSKYAGMMGL